MIGLHIIEQSLTFLPFALGVYLSYAILCRADLTVDGSFVLGAGVFAKSLHLTGSLILALCFAVGAGALAGLGTSLLQYRDRLSSLISGILALFILQSANLLIMGRPNISLLDSPSILSAFDGVFSEIHGKIVVLTISTIVIFVALSLFLSSKSGLLLRAFGSNVTLLRLMGKNAEYYRILGLALSNALVAFCGAMTAQCNGYADIGMGTGLVLVGIGTVLIGQQLISSFPSIKIMKMPFRLATCIAGVFIYFSLVNCLISFGVNPIYLKMMMGLSLALIMLIKPSSLVQQRST